MFKTTYTNSWTTKYKLLFESFNDLHGYDSSEFNQIIANCILISLPKNTTLTVCKNYLKIIKLRYFDT